MFDGSLPEIADLAALDDAELVDAAGGWSRAENAACARKLAVMAEIFHPPHRAGRRRARGWWIDPDAAVSAELAAALNVSRGLALHQTHRGLALRDRLPKVAALFEAGLISDLLVRTIVSRTYLITDAEAMAAVDAELADRVTGGGRCRSPRPRTPSTRWSTTDPGALRRAARAATSATVEFGSPADAAGITSMWARLYAPDAALIDSGSKRWPALCVSADPRTLADGAPMR